MPVPWMVREMGIFHINGCENEQKYLKPPPSGGIAETATHQITWRNIYHRIIYLLRCLARVWVVCFEGQSSSHHIFSALVVFWMMGPPVRISWLLKGGLLPSCVKKAKPTWETYEETRVTNHLQIRGWTSIGIQPLGAPAADVQGRGVW